MDVWRWGVKMAKKAWTYLKVFGSVGARNKCVRNSASRLVPLFFFLLLEFLDRKIKDEAHLSPRARYLTPGRVSIFFENTGTHQRLSDFLYCFSRNSVLFVRESGPAIIGPIWQKRVQTSLCEIRCSCMKSSIRNISSVGGMQTGPPLKADFLISSIGKMR